MISREHFMPVNYFKKDAFTGSDQGMRYLVRKQEEGLEAYVWPEPYGFEATPEDLKQRAVFEFSKEGVLAAVDWLNEQKEGQPGRWS